MDQVRAKKGRSLWWVVHSWIGLKLSIFLTFILATGTFAVFAHEIDWLATPAMRVSPRSEPVTSWGALAQAAVRAAPDARLQTLYAPIDPWFAVEPGSVAARARRSVSMSIRGRRKLPAGMAGPMSTASYGRPIVT